MEKKVHESPPPPIPPTRYKQSFQRWRVFGQWIQDSGIYGPKMCVPLKNELVPYAKMWSVLMFLLSYQLDQ